MNEVQTTNQHGSLLTEIHLNYSTQASVLSCNLSDTCKIPRDNIYILPPRANKIKLQCYIIESTLGFELHYCPWTIHSHFSLSYINTHIHIYIICISTYCIHIYVCTYVHICIYAHIYIIHTYTHII